MQVEIKDHIIKLIREYCDINGHTDDWVEITNNLLYKGLMISKYGVSPQNNQEIEVKGTNDFLITNKNESNTKEIDSSGLETTQSIISRRSVNIEESIKPNEETKTEKPVIRRTIKRKLK